MPNIAIQAKELTKWFGEGDAKTSALKDVELEAHFGVKLLLDQVGHTGTGPQRSLIA
jgi:putative ABC transport system ATP-binding protein